MQSLTKLHIFNLNKGVAVRQFTFSPAHRTLILAPLITGLIIAATLAVVARFHHPPPNEDVLGQHYVRLISVAVAGGDQAEINRILTSMTADEQILRATVFSLTGERLGQQGAMATLPQLLREDATLTSDLLPITSNSQIIGYLQWVRKANSRA